MKYNYYIGDRKDELIIEHLIQLMTLETNPQDIRNNINRIRQIESDRAFEAGRTYGYSQGVNSISIYD